MRFSNRFFFTPCYHSECDVIRVERRLGVSSNEREDGLLTTQHSDPRRDATHKGVEVLSHETDLDALLEAILGDELAAAETSGRPRDAIAAPAVAADAPPGLAAVPPLAQVDPKPAFARDVVSDHDAWGFVSEDAQTRNELAHDFTPILHEAPASVARAGSLPTWHDTLRVSWSRQSLLVAALSAAALITASAITLREEPTPTQTAAASDAPAPSESSPLVQSVSAVKATEVSQVKVGAPARERRQRSPIISRTPSRRSTEAPAQRTSAPALRTSAPAKPALVDAARSAPAASPVIEAPSSLERITQPTEREAAPSPTELPAQTEQRRLSDSTPAGVASDAAAVKGEEPVPAAAASRPAAALRRTAARLVTGPAPEYPPALRTARIGGSVELLLTIDATGRVIKVQSVTGHPQLRSAAEAAVRRWRYEAARLDNLAVETQTMVRFYFDPSTEHRPQE